MAVLLSGTTIGGHVAVHANNISTYALTSVPANVITTSGGQTIAGITYFSNGESLNLYGIRGRFTNEYIHLYEKVGIGHPGGWGQGEANTPTQGLSIYGGINIAYARDNGATINTYTRINKNWGGGDYSAEQFTIRGTYPSIALRSTQHNNVWLIHNDDTVSFYYGGGVDSNDWSRRLYIQTNGDIWMSWAGANISTLLDAKQNASTAITTSNIGSQSVSYASSAGETTFLSALGDYVFNASTNGRSFARGLQASFVRSEVDGYPSYGSVVRIRTYTGSNDGGTAELYFPYSNQYGGSSMRYRLGLYNNAGWTGWKTVIDSDNIGGQSVSYADESGYSASTGTTDNIGGVQFRNTGSNAGTNADTIDSNGITYYTAGVANFSGNATDGALYSQRYSTSWQHQIAGDYRSGQIALRGRNNGTWQAWRTVLDSSNFTSWAQEKENQRLSTGNGPTFAEVYTNGWFRNNNINTGLYNQNTGTHFYSNGGAGWVVTGSGGEIQLQFRSNHQSTLRGYVYADTSNNIGFLNNAGNWSLRTDSSRNTEIYGSLQVNSGTSFSGNTSWFGGYGGGSGPGMALENQNTFARFAFWGLDFYDWNHGIQMTIDNNYVSATNSFRAPVFYDSNDTNYYGDFAGFSRLSEAGITNTYTYNYFNVDSSRAVSEFGNVGVFRARRSGTADYPSFSFQHQFGNHSWGQIARFHIEGSGGSDRPSVQFSSAYNNTRWNIGYCTGSDDNFRISQNMGYRPDGSGVSDSWGTERFRINTDGTAYLPSTLYTNEISHANGRVLLSGNMHIDTYNGNDIFMNYYSARGTRIYVGSGTLALHVNTDGLVYMPTVVVNSHSDNTKGYRIHNTSGTTVSAMFVNSSNQLVIAAGAVDQVNLNKKVLVNGVALGVNVAPSATAGRIDASNDIVAYSSSDERLKYNIAPIENALDKVKSLTGVEFDWKPEYKHAHGYEGHDTGIIAQQVEAVMPSAVRTNDTGFLAVRYEKLIGLLIEANKELAARVEELEKKIG